MHAFKELRIVSPNGDRSKLLLFLENLRTANNESWPFLEKQTKDYASNIFKDHKEVAVFSSPVIRKHRATVWLILSGKEVRVTNIVPTTTGKLSYEEYNAILDLFFLQMVKPAARASEVDILTTAAEIHLEELIGEETYKKLAIWESVSNNSSGNTHDLDFERWADFLTTAFHRKSRINAQLLQRWLLEDKGWRDGEIVQRLGSEFEYGMDLLNYYVDHK